MQGALTHPPPELTTLKTFKELGIPANLMHGLQELGIIHPTEIQDKAIPFLLEDGGDLIAQAQTGTGTGKRAVA